MSSTGLLFRSPSDVRAIPNQQWEAWLRDGGLPFEKFSADQNTQMCLRAVLRATKRRMGL